MLTSDVSNAQQRLVKCIWQHDYVDDSESIYQTLLDERTTPFVSMECVSMECVSVRSWLVSYLCKMSVGYDKL